jgi:hypothetical protein
MELLTIQHEDFTMYVECSKYEAIWGKAVRNVGEDNLHTTYTWTDGVKSATIGDEPLENGSQAKAVFFDNAEYPVWVEFGNHVSKALFGSMLRADNERFSFRGHTLAGFINYGNEIGRSELQLVYNIGKEQKHFKLSYEVLSTKLNYHEHWKKIVEDIEAEYRMLALDYMKRTFHGFSPDTKGDTPELIWWSIFAGEQEKFVKACRSIIERPRRRLRGYEVYLRADKLKRVPANIENELAEHRKEQAHLYRVEEHIQSNDTQENRFLKYALEQISMKYETLKKRIETIRNTSEYLKQEMDEVEKTLTHLKRNPFFRTVGRFKGLTQESLVLQRATGYSQVYRTWNLLRRAYSLNDGMYRLQSKDIATLYEIWCFIEVSHIVKKQLGKDIDVDHRNRMEMSGVFTWELGKGEHSRILFRKDGVELAELVYNPKHTEKENDSISMEHLVVPTVPQKPDIVLQLTKDDIKKGMKMTYLFDAKYRINDRTNEGVDTPPDDAINQMHRYRDAIYYKDNQNADGKLKKEVIGGYILFPGNGDPLEVAKAKFQQSLDEVNIGAFPLRPNDKDNRKLLEEFIQKLIGCSASKILDEAIPQKGLHYTESEPVYFVISGTKKENPEDWEKLHQGLPCRFCCGFKGPREDVDLQSIRFLAPVFGHQFYGFYKVKAVRTKELSDNQYPVRVEFELTDYTALSSPVKYGIPNAPRGVPFTLRDFCEYCSKHVIS